MRACARDLKIPLGSLLVLLLLGAVAPPAAAADPPSTATAAEVKALFASGVKSYNLGDFQTALQAFKDAYKIKSDPAFLFNIGQCHRQMSNPREALYAYRRYLSERPEAANRVEVEKFIVQMEELQRTQAQAQAKKEEAATKPPPPVVREPIAPIVVMPATPPPTPPAYRRWWFWTTIGGAILAGLAAGIGIGYMMGSPRDAALPPTTAGIGTVDFPLVWR